MRPIFTINRDPTFLRQMLLCKLGTDEKFIKRKFQSLKNMWETFINCVVCKFCFGSGLFQ